tara:strand:- start:2970 stop:3134 length:165 start_codon:yes stop_codon:yes gene_type:complete
MINHLIIIKLNGVHKEEQKNLKKYLEYNCWDWKEINQDTIIKELIIVDDNGIPK